MKQKKRNCISIRITDDQLARLDEIRLSIGRFTTATKALEFLIDKYHAELKADG